MGFVMSIKLGNKNIGVDSDAIYVIAEAGVNHLGSLELAERIIVAAKQAGADAVKFQSYKAKNLCIKDAPRFWNWEGEVKKGGTQYDSYSLLDQFGKEEHLGLKKLCEKHQIEFFSTPFDEEAADYLDEIGTKFYKMASCDVTNHYFLEYVALKKNPILLSTGASNLDEIKEAVEVIEKTGNRNIIIMHCNLCYPTKDEDSNLRMILHLKSEFPEYPVGLSDHTMNMLSPAIAYGLGARVFERHFTVDKTLDKSADHWLSADESDLKEIVGNLKLSQQLLGKYEKLSTKSEEAARNNARRSVVSLKAIKKGEVFTVENVACKRPGTGISAKFFKDILGKKAKFDLKGDVMLELDSIEGFSG